MRAPAGVRLLDVLGNPLRDGDARLTSSPVYYHNYMLGNLLASQLLHHMATKIVRQDDINTLNLSRDPRLGKYLKEKVFSPGKTWKWDELIKRATGEPLNPAYFAQDVTLK